VGADRQEARHGEVLRPVRKLDDLALDVIGGSIGRVTARGWIAVMESTTRSSRKTPAGKRPSRKKTAAAKGTKKAALPHL
jgi:hypothetical protein